MGDNLGSILGVWAHPDDEAYLSAGLMMRAIASEHQVSLVTATRGEAGFPDDDPRSDQERRRVRERELADCLGVLGVSDHRWLGYRDGSCALESDRDAAAAIAQVIAEVRPDTILTFGPDGMTWHSDHIAVCRWTTRATELSRGHHRLLYATKTHAWVDKVFRGLDLYEVMMLEGLETEAVPESELAVSFTCDDELLARKVRALRKQSSQIDPLVRRLGLSGFAVMVKEEFFRAPVASDAASIERAKALGNG